MTVAAPPKPPPLVESLGSDPGEALIKEAKQRARRRRWIYAVVVAIAAVAGFSTLPSGPSPPHRSGQNVPTPPAPTPLGAPLVQGPDPASTLLASWSGMHFGYVFVYADGRVIWGGVDRDSMRSQERRLTPYSLQLVRAGKLTAADLLLGSRYLLSDMQEKVWADPAALPHEAPEYAVFLPEQIPPGPDPRYSDFDLDFDHVPEPAKVLLSGKQRTYDPGIGFLRTPGVPPGPLMEGFEVTAAEAHELRQRFGDTLTLWAIYPHGQPVIWGVR